MGNIVRPITSLVDFELAVAAGVAGPPHPAPTIGKNPPIGMIGQEGFAALECMFAGDGSDNGTITYNIWAIRRLGGINAADRLYVPLKIGTVLVTLSTLVGIAGGKIGPTTRFADNVSYTALSAWPTYATGVSGRSPQHWQPADNLSPGLLGMGNVGGINGWVFQLTAFAAGATRGYILYNLWI